jgi:hypothetical protein
MQTINDDNRRQSTGVTRMRCAECKRFARLLPGETKCAPCLGALPLDLSAVLGGGRR